MLFQRNVCAQCVRDDQCETGKFCSYGLCSRIRESKFCSNDFQCYLHFNGDRDYYCTGGGGGGGGGGRGDEGVH